MANIFILKIMTCNCAFYLLNSSSFASASLNRLMLFYQLKSEGMIAPIKNTLVALVPRLMNHGVIVRKFPNEKNVPCKTNFNAIGFVPKRCFVDEPCTLLMRVVVNSINLWF